MKRIPVRSSVIRSAGYDPRTTTLQVEFRSKLVYNYRRVPRARFNALLKAESKGRYFNANIRDCYPFAVIESTKPTAERH
jgi:hypothetical protein